MATALVPRLSPAVNFPGGEVNLDVALANEDVLAPGRYEAKVAIVGPDGWRWQRSVDIEVDGRRGPLAVPVLSERLALGGGPGRYRCAASLGTSAAPAAGRLDAEVIAPPAPLTLRRPVAALCFGEAGLAWLAANGIEVATSQGPSSDVDLVLVGHAGDWPRRTGKRLPPWSTGAPPPSCSTHGNSLSQGRPRPCSRSGPPFRSRSSTIGSTTKSASPEKPLVTGLQEPGLMKWRLYDQVLPRHLLQGEAEDVAAFAVTIGFPCPGGYASGLIAATFRHGAGRVVVSTFELLAHVGSLAVADQLTVNLLRYAAG